MIRPFLPSFLPDDAPGILPFVCFLQAARRWSEVLLRMCPDHVKGQRLHALIRRAVEGQGKRNIENAAAAGVAGAVVLGAVGLGFALAAGAVRGGRR